MAKNHSDDPLHIASVLTEAMDRLHAHVIDQHNKQVEAAAQPGETFAQAEARLCSENATSGTPKRPRENEMVSNSIPSSLRKPPAGDAQPDFFVPALYDVGTKDSRSIMDVAVFRLSKRDKRAGEIIRYELSDGYVEVKAGPDGMASIWDYDLILMMVSHLTEAMNQYRDGKSEKPGQAYRLHISDILKFCRRGDGGRQADEIEAALDRLKGTTIKVVRERSTTSGKPMREVKAEGLIGGYSVLSQTDLGKVASVEIEAPTWLYKEVTDGKRPDVLTVHPDYFLIDPGIGRFVYRLARRAAGKGQATWSFKTIFERSGSAGTFKEFCRLLRKVIQSNDLPEYILHEEMGQDGPLLKMSHLAHAKVDRSPPRGG